MKLMSTFLLFTGLAISGAVHAADMWIAGPEGAPITIEEFADFDCSYCARGNAVIKEVLRAYPTQVRLVFRNAPLAAHGSSAVSAARAMAAVWLQNSALAFSYQDILFTHQDELLARGDAFLFEAAKALDLDIQRLKADMQGATVAEMLTVDQHQFQAHGFQGTPSFVVGHEMLRGAYSFKEFKKVIDRQL